MLKIWGRNNSVNVQKVMWLVGELGLAHERIDAGLQYGLNTEDWYLAMNPNGRVPVIDDGGTVLWESHSIVRYLAARHASGTWYPEDPAMRAQSEKWMDWNLSMLQAPMTVVFWQLVRTPEAERNMAAVESNLEAANRLWTLFDGAMAGRDFVGGAAPDVGDIPMGAMAYRWLNMEIERPDVPNIRAWYDRLADRPAYREHVMLPIT